MVDSDKRKELHSKLTDIFSGQVLYQPPESVKLTYPCIIYNLTGMYTRHGSDNIYKAKRSYKIMLIDKNPDSTYIDTLLSSFKMIRFDQAYVVDNLNHFIFTLYY